MTKDEKFRNYYQTFYDLVSQYVFSRVGNFETAQKITQQVFYKFFQKMNEIPDSMVKAWLLFYGRSRIAKEGLRKSRKKHI